MKNEQLKAKLLKKNERQPKDVASVEVMNKEQLVNAQGGRNASCPNLVSCGVYGLHNCTIKTTR